MDNVGRREFLSMAQLDDQYLQAVLEGGDEYVSIGLVTLACQINGKRTVSAVSTTYDGDRITGTIAGLDGTVSRMVNTRIGDCSESSFGN